MKTVIHTWTHHFNINNEHLKKYNYLKETEFYFCLGDLIRSTIKLFYLAKQLNFELIVDIQLHPISEFLKINDHKYSEYVFENKTNVNYVCYGAIEDYINDSKEDVIMIITNDLYEGDVDEECRSFIKNIFVANDKMERFISLKMSYIPYKTYNIIHYPAIESDILNKNEEFLHKTYLNYLTMSKEYNDILVTESKSFKNYIFLYNNVFFFDLKRCHLGLSRDSDSIRDTLFEFFLITKSSKIKTYCKVYQLSSLIKWISKIYNIPCIPYN